MSAAIGIDVGGTTIKSGLVNEAGDILSRHVSPTPKDVSLLVDQLAQHVEHHVSSGATQSLAILDAIGVVVPGIVDDIEGIAVYSSNLDWRDVPMRSLISQGLGRPVSLGHDVRAGALAEFELLEESPVQLYVALGTGMAATLKVHGQVLINGGWAGELGQALVLDPDTGARVALEKVVSASALVNRYQTLTGQTLTDGSREVFTRAKAGDPIAQRVITLCIEYLAEALAQVSCLFGSIDIVIGGGLSLAQDDLIEPLRAEIDSLLNIVPSPRVTRAQRGDSSQIIGASLLARSAQAELVESTAGEKVA